MMDEYTILMFGFIGVVSIGFCAVLTIIFGGPKPAEESAKNGTTGSRKDSAINKKSKIPNEKGPRVKSKPRSRTTSASENYPNHPWHAALFKGHKENITDLSWSSNGKFLASCAQDRTVLIWIAKDLLAKDRRSIRVNVPFDSARLLSWSPDSTAFIIAREEEKVLEVYKLGKKTEGAHITVNQLIKFRNIHDEDIVGIGIACSGLYIMSCSEDGNMILWDLKGVVLERVNIPGNCKVYAAKVSPCGRYIAVCGTDCLIFQVSFNNMREFQSVKSYGKLKGHEAKVRGIDFNSDSSRIVTVTETGTWRVFDTTGNRVNVILMGKVKGVPKGEEFFPKVALSHDGRLVAVGYDNQIDIFEVKMGTTACLEPSWTIPCEDVNSLVFSSDGKFLLGSGGKTIQVFHNVGGYYATLTDLKRQLHESSTSSALKDRLKKEVKAITEDLKKLNLEGCAEGLPEKVENLKIS